MIHTAVRRLQFCAGHRVYKHESKCKNLHGHNYVVFLHARRATGLDEIGRVVDFSVLKSAFLPWIEQFWDHGFLLFKGDPLVEDLPAGHKYYVMEENPTAENMAVLLLSLGPTLLPREVELFKVVLYETENCFAEAELPPMTCQVSCETCGPSGYDEKSCGF